MEAEIIRGYNRLNLAAINLELTQEPGSRLLFGATNHQACHQARDARIRFTFVRYAPGQENAHVDQRARVILANIQVGPAQYGSRYKRKAYLTEFETACALGNIHRKNGLFIPFQLFLLGGWRYEAFQRVPDSLRRQIAIFAGGKDFNERAV